MTIRPRCRLLFSVTLVCEGRVAGKNLVIREIHYYFLRVETFCFGCCIFFFFFFIKVFIFLLKKPLCKNQILILNEVISKNYEDEFDNHS